MKNSVRGNHSFPAPPILRYLSIQWVKGTTFALAALFAGEAQLR
jgi:hypothetical protein